MNHTDRPDATGLPTVAEIVEMESVRRGLAEVLAGRTDAAVRWVHVSDSDRVANLLDGGELLLTTGAGWAGTDAALRTLVASLAAAGLAGVVLELGTRFRTVPPALVAACRAHDLALVTLENEVKFVTLTEQVHRRIIAGQLDALEQRQRLHELFTGLTLRGAPADVIVRETARALRAPVVLENLAHEVVAADLRDEDVADVLGAWGARSRAIPDAWTAVPVEARGTRWGTLVALDGDAHPVGRMTVLELAATALALGRLADGDGAWERLAAHDLIAAVLGERDVSAGDAALRLEASGFALRGRELRALCAAGTTGARVEGALALVREEMSDARVLGAAPDGEGLLLLSLPGRAALPAGLLRRVADALGTGVALGAPATTFDELLASLPAARLLAPQVARGEVRHVDDRPLTRLIAQLHGDQRVQEHSERMLEPLIRHDLATDGDLVRVLRAVVAHPGNRTAAASASHLSRSVFYQRLALISELLGADLDDGETLAALHLAVLARGR